VTRTQAVKKLQVTLKDFRRLCILKGIYPREPKKKFKGGSTTYYFAKDIMFLSHEPLLEKFREQKAFLKKIRRACGRHEKKIAKRLDGRRPEYRLDHIIRERYPSFLDALQDLDDALCLVHLFASLASSKFVPVARVANCCRLASEFQAYVVKMGCLHKVFVSIKGFYYQAQISGTTLTWIVPHSFAQQPTMQVDYRVMLSFLELYEALLTLVNFKLYHTLGVAYPPQIDKVTEGGGPPLSAIMSRMARSSASSIPALASSGSSQDRPPTAKQIKALRSKLETVEREPVDAADADSPADTAEAADPLVDDGPDLGAVHSLFKGCTFFLGRETPLASLEFVLLACGASVGWDGEGSRFSSTESDITHQVVDRPLMQQSVSSREFVQPQWVYDCVNARTLLPTHPYRPGVTCPPHLSPFHDGVEGYTPIERLRLAMQEGAAGAGEMGALDEEEDEEVGGGSDDDAEDDEDDEDEDDADEDEDEDEDEDVDVDDNDNEESAQYARELAAEVAGVPYSDASTKGRPKPKRARPVEQRDEEQELAKLMMSRKKRRLYDRMQYGIQRKAAARDVLVQKKEAIDAVRKTKKKQDS